MPVFLFSIQQHPELDLLPCTAPDLEAYLFPGHKKIPTRIRFGYLIGEKVCLIPKLVLFQKGGQ